MSAEVIRLWWITLGIALFVVVPVVVLLLHLLLASVKRTECAVIELWRTATTVARNTATTWQLDVTGDALEGIKIEALRHDALLDAARSQPTGGRS